MGINHPCNGSFNCCRGEGRPQNFGREGGILGTLQPPEQNPLGDGRLKDDIVIVMALGNLLLRKVKHFSVGGKCHLENPTYLNDQGLEFFWVVFLAS